MKRPAAILLVVLLASTFPAVDAGEIMNAEYDVPSGPTGNQGQYTQATRFCAPEWREWNNGLLSDGQDSTVFGDPDDNPDDDLVGGTMRAGFTAGCEILDPLNGGPDDGFVRMGIGRPALQSECGDCYQSFLVSVTDIVPADTFFAFCIITDYQDGRDLTDSVCGEDPRRPPPTYPLDDVEDPRVEGCGSAGITSPVEAGGTENQPSGLVYATYVDTTTGGVCLGMKGTMTVDMS